MRWYWSCCCLLLVIYVRAQLKCLLMYHSLAPNRYHYFSICASIIRQSHYPSGMGDRLCVRQQESLELFGELNDSRCRPR